MTHCLRQFSLRDFEDSLQIQEALTDTLPWAVSLRDFEDSLQIQAALTDTLPWAVSLRDFEDSAADSSSPD